MLLRAVDVTVVRAARNRGPAHRDLECPGSVAPDHGEIRFRDAVELGKGVRPESGGVRSPVEVTLGREDDVDSQAERACVLAPHDTCQVPEKNAQPTVAISSPK